VPPLLDGEFTADAAESAAEAVTKLASAGTRYDAILLDVCLLDRWSRLPRQAAPRRPPVDSDASIAYNDIMAASPDPTRASSLNIRQLDPTLKERLRIRAAHHGRSMEAEARAILREALTNPRPASGTELVDAIRRRFAPLGDVELELPPRAPAREPPRFE
jgi:plasmid stability protein